MKSILLIITTLVLSFLLLPSCSKQTKALKPYHNITGRYNAYYNANMRLTESFDMLNKQHQDNYNKLLHMYPYAAVASADAVAKPLDEAITKAARNVVLHRIGNWTDNSYLLMGKSEFLLQKYEKSAATFKYIVEKYHPDNIAKEEAKLKKKKKKKRKKKKRKKKKRKKKKKKKKPNTGKDEEEEEEKPQKGIGHKSIRYEAMLWLAKSYIELGMYDEAGYNLRQLENDEKVPYKLRPQVQAVIAYSWVQQKELEKAIPALEKAIETTKRKTIKNRYAYLLAQIYQEQGNSELAMDYFRKTLKMRPNYEMEFNARLNMIKNAASVNGKKTIDPEIALRRMLRDSKNEEYKDQIYFALAQIRLKAGDAEGGIAALQQSLANGSNPMQRTEGCLLLAELYYNKEDYIKSYSYYDSTIVAMKKEDERYATTAAKKERLKGVATNLELMVYRDSMMAVGNLERRKQESWATKSMAIDELNPSNNNSNAPSNKPNNNEKGPARWKNAQGMNPATNTANRNNASNGGPSVNDNAIQQSKFALYNPNLLKKGAKEFEKRWGERAWTDNWRRANKKSDESVDNQEIAGDAPPKTQAEIDGYLKKKGVPQNDAEKTALEDKLAEATYMAASHYQEDLGRKDKALQLVKEVVDKYPKSPYAVEALFLAYNIHYAAKNTKEADKYKKEILSKYPDSKIAKVLQDPDFANSAQKKYQAVNQYYDDTYSLIQTGQAQKALDNVKKVPDLFGANYEMKARFAILEAMCVGGIKGEQEYIRALRVVVTSFPNTKEEKQAIAMLAVLTDKKPTINTPKNIKKSALVPFKVDMEAKHLVVIVFENKRTRVNQYKTPVNTFNTQNYPNKKFNISTILVDGTKPTITVRTFLSGQEAMQYATNARSNPKLLNGATGFKIYSISQQNYNLALSTQNFAAYDTFHDKNYK